MIQKIKALFAVKNDKDLARREIERCIAMDCLFTADEIIAVEGLDHEYPEIVAQVAKERELIQ